MYQQIKPSKSPAIWAVIPAAGVGRRMAHSVPKQYLKVQGKTILEHSLDQLCRCEFVAGVAVGIAANDDYWDLLEIKNEKLLGSYLGGIERIHTVMKGLEFLSGWAAKEDWVMVHDAVRPCVALEDINRLVDQARRLNRSAILATPVIDTVKKVTTQGGIQATLNRDELMLAATPQLFPIARLKQALQSAVDRAILSTDESAAVEMLGDSPLVVRAERSNIKITTSEDLPIAEMILQNCKDR